jgi:ADP-heptose:LPS heptosyltransferase
MKSLFDNVEVPKPNTKELPSSHLRAFGNLENKLVYVNKLDELRESPPNIVVAEAVRSIQFSQNNFTPQRLIKKSKYVMSIGVFKQLWSDPRTGTKILKPAAVKFKKIFRPYIGQDLHNKSILVTRTGGIGDLLFIKPNLDFLKKKYPTCTIYFACGPQYHAMVETWDCIDELHTLPFPLKYLTKSNYHVIFEGVIERCKESHTKNAYQLFTRWMGLNLPDDFLIPKQKAKPDIVEECKKYLEEHNIKQFFIMQLRASSPIRTPRTEFWVKMIEKLIKRDKKRNIIITDSPHVSDNIDLFILSLPDELQPHVFNFAKISKTLDKSIALASLADCAISTDSSLIHIAASLGIPVFGVYGPFPGHIRMSTYHKCSWVDAKEKCAPCFIHGHRNCPNSDCHHSKCYDNINMDECIKKIEGIIQ